MDDERFADPRDRRSNASVLVAELDAVFATRPLAEWAEAFAEEPELFWAPVNSIEDLLADEQFLAAGSVVQVPDEAGGRAMLATPADFGGVPSQPRWRAPALGEHTRQVLTELHLDAATIDGLIAEGVATTA